MGSGNGFGCVFGVKFWASADQFASGWVMYLEGGARGGLHPLAIDVADVRLEEGRVVELMYFVISRSSMIKSEGCICISQQIYAHVRIYLANHGGGESVRGQ